MRTLKNGMVVFVALLCCLALIAPTGANAAKVIKLHQDRVTEANRSTWQDDLAQ